MRLLIDGIDLRTFPLRSCVLPKPSLALPMPSYGYMVDNAGAMGAHT